LAGLHERHKAIQNVVNAMDDGFRLSRGGELPIYYVAHVSEPPSGEAGRDFERDRSACCG
jgi:hypothetical protein